VSKTVSSIYYSALNESLTDPDLHRYCECFANKVFCSGCNCEGCFNTENNKEMVQQAIAQAIERNPEAFKPKIEVMPMVRYTPQKSVSNPLT
jgi:hypothetical protein